MEKIPVRQIKTAHESVSSSFNIRRVENLCNGKDLLQPLHRHNFYFILVLKKGSGTHDIDFISYQVDGKSIFVMRPGQAHKLMLSSDSIGYLMEFNADFLSGSTSQLLRTVSKTNHRKLDDAIFEKVQSNLENVYHEFDAKRHGYIEVINANLNILFIELIRQNSQSISDNTNHSLLRLDNFLELIETHFYKHKDVSFYADAMSLSSYQLNTITRSTVGKNASQIIIEHIILESKRYLLATTSQINQIADYLGYEDVSYFVRFFKKHTGHSPDAFRKNFN